MVQVLLWRIAAGMDRRCEVTMGRRSGISNRQSPEQEAEDRAAHPPLDAGSPPPADAAGRVGERPLSDRRDRHTSHKAGSRSIAQKEDASKYADRSMPPARKVAGAFGREPDGPARRDREESIHPSRRRPTKRG
jgi:hypothetical protein